MAVTQQPTQYGMQMNPVHMTGVPPGMEYLASTNEIFVKQKVELMEVITGFETKNKYKVLDNQGQQIYYCSEESECCHRVCCGPMRGFVFHITDNNNREVLTLKREFRCCVGNPLCADGCCQYPIEIFDGQGQKIGMTRVTKFCCAPRFGVFDTEDNQMYQITGDICRCQCPLCCPVDVHFPILAMNGDKVANITKKYRGAFHEFLTDADSYHMTFPQDMHVIHKALMFASIFLVDVSLNEKQE